SAGIVEGDHQPPAEYSAAAIEADTELFRSGGFDATGRQVRMRAVNVAQSKTQRRGSFSFFRNQLQGRTLNVRPTGSALQFQGRKVYPVAHNCLRPSRHTRRGARFGTHRNGPNEPQQFAAYGGDNLVLVLSSRRELVVSVVKPPLRFPGKILDFLIQALLA